MAYFYNRLEQRVEVTIEGFSDYDVVAASITTDDIKSNIFNNVLTSALSLTLSTTSEAIYTGSLVSKSVTLTIGSEIRNFTIVTNVADMDANLMHENVEIEAVDTLTLYKNERYEEHGYKKVSEIATDILGECVFLEAWGGTDVADIMLNVDVMWEDDAKTAPLKYDVLQAICSYINRSLYYNYEEQLYVFFAINSTSKDGVLHNSEGYMDYTVNSHAQIVTINASTIAASDRRISLDDPWQSATITDKFEDADIKDEAKTYSETPDEGEMSVYKEGKTQKVGKYVAYWATTEGQRHYKDDNVGYQGSATIIDPISNQTIVSTKTDAEYDDTTIGHTYHFGGRLVSVASGIEDSTGDVEGNINTEEYIMGWRNVNSVIYSAYPIYRKTIQTSQIVTDDLYLILGGSVLFSRYPIPEDTGEQSYATTTAWARRFRVTVTHTDGTTLTREVYAKVIKERDNSITRGSSYTIQNNVYWRHKVSTTGTLVELCSTSTEGKIISKIDIDVYMGLHSTGASTQTVGMITAYEFIQVDYSIEHASSVNSDLFDTDTIYKWVNDDSDSVICSGNEYTEEPKFVTYDGKRSGNNCASYDCYDVKLTDDKRYEGSTCNSETRRIHDLAAQYKECTFGEQITVRGLYWWGCRVKDNYFNKMCTVVNLALDIVDGTTTITTKHLKA